MVEAHFLIMTAVPGWFFRDSLPSTYTICPRNVDVGLVQHSALQIDLPATVEALQHLYAREQKTSLEISSLLAECDVIISDISPMAFAAAREEGIPSILVENFTWDWIYKDYLASVPEIGPYISLIRQRYSLADYRIQAEPVCLGIKSDLRVAPVARKKRDSRETIRARLGIDNDRSAVLISMGGEGIRRLPTHLLEDFPEVVFLVSGLRESVPEINNLRIIPEDSGVYHPDLVASVDAVIGKVGYSTLAEVYHSGTPYGYIPRADFRETGPLVGYIEKNMAGMAIAAEDFFNGRWLEMLPELIAMKSDPGMRINGADQIAGFIADLLS